MPVFLLGLGLGAISGGGTYAYTTNGQLAALVALVALVATWLGIALLLILDVRQTRLTRAILARAQHAARHNTTKADRE